ncbi:P-loop containing nucleoside triphosphate hydrolase protein [Geopyxis carbonaria]|nr:P-loop containing nucleoside triphosphate hydrolase protein [Geopyxis carbonaria]
MPQKSFKPTRDRKQRSRNRKADNVSSTTTGTNDGAEKQCRGLVLDTNAEIIHPVRKPVGNTGEPVAIPAMSSKKKKRLDKYIEAKMKKEKRGQLLDKLAEVTIDTTLFASSKSMGASRESKKQRIQRALLEEKAGLNMESNVALLYEYRQPRDSDHSSVKSSSSPIEAETPEPLEARPEVGTSLWGGVAVGSGLKRPLNMNISEVPPTKRIKAPIQREVVLQEDQGVDISDSEEEWAGFSDSSHSEEEISDSDLSESTDSEHDEHVGKRIINGNTAKASAFKQWAMSQKAASTPGGSTKTESNIDSLMSLKLPTLPVARLPEEDKTPPPEEHSSLVTRKACFVPVERSIDLQTTRLKLPVVAEEQRIMEAIHNNACVVICGETGSGKTTQIPQFLYEAGYGSKHTETPGLIGVTQPRRVAAVAMADRVGNELGEGGRKKVAYQIRFDGTVGLNTAIKFMTDGVLLRELANDFTLSKYSAIVIDEAHERSINTDILIGVMSRVLRLRADLAKQDPKNKPLKLIIMSATLRVSDFVDNQRLFPIPPPLLKVEARQHPVTIHFSRRTAIDYVEETYRKICRIHRRLPAGGILVFLTGQNEIIALRKKLLETFPLLDKDYNRTTEGSNPKVKVLAREAILEVEDIDLGAVHSSTDMEDENLSEDDENLSEEDDLGDEMGPEDVEAPLHVLPLYSLLPTKEQLKVFEEPLPGSRLCILATNIAETSLTIPGITYVVDCGRSKERKYDNVTGVQSFDIQWISKASAAQRAGRAGRTSPGHCYRLFSSAIYERDFTQFAEAEILRMPIEGVVLQMKAMGIDTIVNFPFPTPPNRQSLQSAERLLKCLRAISTEGVLTELGQTMNIFPLAPRFAKMLIIGQQHGCLPYIIAIVAALSVGNIFLLENQLSMDLAGDDPTNTRKRSSYHRAHANFTALDSESDVIKLLSVVCAFEYEENPVMFCERNFVHLKAMEETRKLRQQITRIIIANCPGVISSFQARLDRPSDLQVKALKQIVAAGFIDHVAIRADLLTNSPFRLGQFKRLRDVPFVTLFPSNPENTGDIFDDVTYVHPSSALYMKSSYPEYLVYSSLTKSNHGKGRVQLHPLTPINGTQLASLAFGTPLITYSKPLESKPPRILPNSDGNRRECWIIPRIGSTIGKSGLGWPLPPQKIIQKKIGNGQKWVNECP